MEKLLEVSGKQVPVKATAATPRIYRARYGRDIFGDLQKLREAVAKGKMLDLKLADCFLDIAYTMAKQADPGIPEDADEWLDQFDMLPMYEILPELILLWGVSEQTTSELKKKAKA